MAIVVAAVLAAWAVGRCILALINSVPREVIHCMFLSLGIGFSIFTSSFAIFRTGGQTVMLPLLLLLIIGLWWLRSRPHQLSPFLVRRREWWLLSEATVVCLGWSLLIFHFMKDDAGEVLYLPPQQDSGPYTRITTFLDEFGIETSMPDWLDPSSAIRSPYHFADVWLAALVHRFSGAPSSIALGCVSSAALLTLSFFVLRLFLGRLFGRQLPNWAARLVALGAIGFGPGLLIPQVIGDWHYLSGMELFSRSMVTANKLLPSMILICYATFCSLNSRTRVATIFALVGTALVDITFVPFIGLAILVQLLDFIRLRHFEELKWSLGAIGCLAIAAVGYALEAKKASLVPRIFHDSFLDEYAPNAASFLGTAFNIVAGSVIRLGLLGSILVLIAAVAYRRNFLDLISHNMWLLWPRCMIPISAFSGLSASVFAWALLHDIPDSVQLSTNVASVLFTCITAATFGSMFCTDNERPTLCFAIGLLLLGLSVGLTLRDLSVRRDALSSEHSIEFQKSARTFFENRTGFGLRFRARSAFINSYSSSIHILGTSNVTTALARSGYEIVIPFEGIPMDSEPLGRARQRSMLSYAPMYKFTGETKFDGPVDEKTILSFLRGIPATHVVFEGVDSLPSTWEIYTSGCIEDIGSRTFLCEWKRPD